MMFTRLMSRETAKELGYTQILQWLPIKTPYGKREKEKHRCYLPGEEGRLEQEFDLMDEMKTLLEQGDGFEAILEQGLRGIKDLSTTLERLMAGNLLRELELFEIKSQVMQMEALRKALAPLPLQGLRNYCPRDLSQLMDLLDPEGSGVNSFYIYSSYSPKLKEIREELEKNRREIQAETTQIHQRVEAYGQVKLQANGEVRVSREQAQRIEQLIQCPDLILGAEGLREVTFRMKASPRLLALMEEQTRLQQLEEEEALQVRKGLCQQVKAFGETLMENTYFLGRLDFLWGKVLLGKRLQGTRPQFLVGDKMELTQARHPVVAEGLASQGRPYTPVDLRLKQGVTLIRGANMGGKTVTLKVVGLIQALAQGGFYVPAERAVLSNVEGIYLSSGDHQSMTLGLSTFGAEMQGLAQILKPHQGRRLILIDELARGTNPMESQALTQAVVDTQGEKRDFTLLTTHHSGLELGPHITCLEVVGLREMSLEALAQAMASGMGIKDLLESHMDFRLVPVDASREVPMEALKIAQLMGIDREIIERAKKRLQKS